MTHSIRAVIFDLDGLLIDSEIVWNTVRTEIAAWRGVTWTEADHRAVMGVSTAEWVAYMIGRLELDLSPPKFNTSLQAGWSPRTVSAFPSNRAL